MRNYKDTYKLVDEYKKEYPKMTSQEEIVLLREKYINKVKAIETEIATAINESVAKPLTKEAYDTITMLNENEHITSEELNSFYEMYKNNYSAEKRISEIAAARRITLANRNDFYLYGLKENNKKVCNDAQSIINGWVPQLGEKVNINDVDRRNKELYDFLSQFYDNYSADIAPIEQQEVNTGFGFSFYDVHNRIQRNF